MVLQPCALHPNQYAWLQRSALPSAWEADRMPDVVTLTIINCPLNRCAHIIILTMHRIVILWCALHVAHMRYLDIAETNAPKPVNLTINLCWSHIYVISAAHTEFVMYVSSQTAQCVAQMRCLDIAETNTTKSVNLTILLSRVHNYVTSAAHISYECPSELSVCLITRYRAIKPSQISSWYP